MQNNNPLNKVVFIQKVAAFIKPDSLKDLFQLAYVNNSWNDTIKNYSFHLFEKQICDIQDTIDDLKKVCANVIKSNVLWFLDVLLFSKTVPDRSPPARSTLHSNIIYGITNLPRLACINHASLDMAQLVFDKIVEIGGPDLLRDQLTKTEGTGYNSLMCVIDSLSAEVVKLVFEKLAGGGKDLLKKQLERKNISGQSCLMLTCRDSSSPVVVRLVFDKVAELVGSQFLKNQISAKDGYDQSCLMLACGNSSSAEVMKVVFERIVDVGGIELLKHQLVERDTYRKNCLQRSCYGKSAEVLKLLTVVLLELDLFKQQYANLDSEYNERLSKKVNIKDSSWVPDPESIAEVRKLLKV